MSDDRYGFLSNDGCPEEGPNPLIKPEPTAENAARRPREGRPVQGCAGCAVYRTEDRACPLHRRVLPPARTEGDQ